MKVLLQTNFSKCMRCNYENQNILKYDKTMSYCKLFVFSQITTDYLIYPHQQQFNVDGNLFVSLINRAKNLKFLSIVHKIIKHSWRNPLIYCLQDHPVVTFTLNSILTFFALCKNKNLFVNIPFKLEDKQVCDNIDNCMVNYLFQCASCEIIKIINRAPSTFTQFIFSQDTMFNEAHYLPKIVLKFSKISNTSILTDARCEYQILVG